MVEGRGGGAMAGGWRAERPVFLVYELKRRMRTVIGQRLPEIAGLAFTDRLLLHPLKYLKGNVVSCCCYQLP
jgi:hypothetical protein